jgi:hypothetical protein
MEDRSFTDGSFHDTGVAWLAGEEGWAFRGSRGAAALEARLPGTGWAARSHRRGIREYKTPTLRDVALRPPYFHDGSAATLTDVVHHYVDGCGDDPRKDPGLRRFEASSEDVADLVAFLESLTGASRPGVARRTWYARADRTRVRIVDGRGLARGGAPVELLPAGDVLPGAKDADFEEQVVVADAEGWIEFAPFLRTHVAVSLRGELLGVVPDTCAEAVLTTR